MKGHDVSAAKAVEAAKAAELKIATIAKTRRPTEAERREARKAYAWAAQAIREETRQACPNCGEDRETACRCGWVPGEPLDGDV